jgi:hypothetical protein
VAFFAGAVFLAGAFLAAGALAGVAFFTGAFLAADFFAGAALVAGVDFFLAGADLADLPVAREDTKDPSTRTVDGRARQVVRLLRTDGART